MLMFIIGYMTGTLIEDIFSKIAPSSWNNHHNHYGFKNDI